MRNSNSPKLQVAMFPWFAFGHFILYLHLSGKLVKKRLQVSFLLPKKAQPKLEQLNHYPNLIQFFPLAVPHVYGIPPSAETMSNVPQPLSSLLAIAFDQTRDQVEAILKAIKPYMVFYDLGHCIPTLAHQTGSKSIHYAVVSAAANTHKSDYIAKGRVSRVTSWVGVIRATFLGGFNTTIRMHKD
ncbi:hypothetical protein QQP08_000661 [Theobroma cacao]|nr:hypothetical protein QQP08_000661 [Theobroma cacao]